MRVRDLIQKLQKLDPELQLLAVSEDEEIVEAGQLMRFLDVDDVSTMTGVTSRDSWGRMGIALGNAPGAQTIATLNVVVHF